MFLSQAFGGRATDSQIVNQSQFIRILEEADKVLADKGFPLIIKDVVNAGALLVMPPRKTKDVQFTEQENKYCYEVASVRVHVSTYLQ